MQDFTSTKVHHVGNKSIMKVTWGSGMRRSNTEDLTQKRGKGNSQEMKF